jgi:electron transfer flavoprotein alpha subunit
LLIGETASEAMAQELIAYGADTVYLAHGYPTHHSLVEFFRQKMPEIVLWSSAAGSRKLAPQVSQLLGASLVSYAVDVMLEPDSRSVLAASPLYDGAAYQIVACHHNPQMVTVMPGSFPTPYRDSRRYGEVIPVELAWAPQPPLNPVEPPHYYTTLESADIVIAGGRGLRNAGWGLIEELAAAFARALPRMQVAVAGSRGAVDAGLIDHDYMVDMTQHKVAPKLYVACGIQGTFQHFGAIEGARCVVAINHNREAPIFKHADYGIVGEVEEVIPALIEALQN